MSKPLSSALIPAPLDAGAVPGPMPAAGGAYERLQDGSLRPIEESAVREIAAPAQPAQPNEKE